MNNFVEVNVLIIFILYEIYSTHVLQKFRVMMYQEGIRSLFTAVVRRDDDVFGGQPTPSGGEKQFFGGLNVGSGLNKTCHLKDPNLAHLLARKKIGAMCYLFCDI